MTERTEREERDARVMIGVEINNAYDIINSNSGLAKNESYFDDLGTLKDHISKNEYQDAGKTIRHIIKRVEKENQNDNTTKQSVLTSLDNIRKIMNKDLWNMSIQKNNDESF